MKRTEPSAWLAPKKGMPKLEYMDSSSTDIRKRFEAIRLAEVEKQRLAASKAPASSTFSVVRGRKA